MLNGLWSTAIAICNQVNMIIFAYASLDNFSVLTKRGHVQMWVSQDFIRQRFCTASTTLTVMIYCICCSFCPIFFSSTKAIQLFGKKKIFTHDARGFTTFLQDGIIRIARSVLSQSPDSEITLSAPQVFLIVHIFFNTSRILLNFPNVSHHFLRYLHSVLQMASGLEVEKQGRKLKNKTKQNT